MKGTIVWFLVLSFVSMTAAAQESAPLRLVQTITMDASITGKFDHMAVDIHGNRVFLTAPEHHSIEVFDLTTGKAIHSVRGLGKPAGIVFLPGKNRVVFSDGEPGSCNVLDATTYRIVGKVKLAQDADSLGLDPNNNIIYVDNGGKDMGQSFSRLSIVDINSLKNLGDVRIDGERLEAMALETSGPRLFLNDTAQNKVVVIDRNKRGIITTWDLTHAKENVAMALDEAGHRLFIATRSPGTLAVFNTDTGKPVAVLPAAAGADDLAYDAAHKRIYLSAGEGFVDVYQQKDPDTYETIAKIPTGPGARNSRFVPEQNRLYVSVPAAKDGKPAKIQVYEVNP